MTEIDRRKAVLLTRLAPLAPYAALAAEQSQTVYAEYCQLMTEYEPDPPFHSGSIKTAPPEVREPMVELLTDFVKKSEALAAAKRG